MDVSLGMFNYCSKDPYYVLGHCLIYMPILIGDVLWCLVLTHGCLAPIMCIIKIFNFRLGSSLQVYLLNKFIHTYNNWLTSFKPLFSNMPNLFGHYIEIG